MIRLVLDFNVTVMQPQALLQVGNHCDRINLNNHVDLYRLLEACGGALLCTFNCCGSHAALRVAKSPAFKIPWVQTVLDLHKIASSTFGVPVVCNCAMVSEIALVPLAQRNRHSVNLQAHPALQVQV